MPVSVTRIPAQPLVQKLERARSVPGFVKRSRRLREFLTTWQAKLVNVDFDKLGMEGRIDK